MKRFLLLYTSMVLLAGCNYLADEKNKESVAPDKYPTISYLDIILDSNKHAPSNPYVLELKKGDKTIVFCGVTHLTDDTDTANELFTKIENSFYTFNPTVCINEGGDITRKLYASKQDALLKDGEIGLCKIMSDSLHILTLNGDPSIEFELKELLKTFSKGEVIAYIVTERLMWGLKGQGITNKMEIADKYTSFVENYICTKGGLSLSDTEKSLAFFTSNYEQLLHRPFAITDLEPTNPFEPNGQFQKIGRASKEIRDQFLISTIDQQLNTHDKIFIVFGSWHLLTCKPGLEAVINRARK
jgi:hypothetical protein